MIIQRKVKNKQSALDILWYVDENNLPEERRFDTIVPTGHIHIVYNLEDPYDVIIDSQEKRMPERLLVGQLKTVMKVKYGHNVRQLGLAIKPSALYYMFHQVSQLYKDTVIDCSQIEVMQDLHHFIENTLKQQPFEINDVLDTIEAYFESKPYDLDEMDIIERLIGYIEDREGMLNIKEMAREFNYSISALERKFKKYIGVSPKAYGDIIRFQMAIGDEHPERLFYDQSHFIRTCKRYTSKVPGEIGESIEISLHHMLDIKSD